MEKNDHSDAYEQQHLAHREAEKLKRLAALSDLSPEAAAVARKLAHRAQIKRALIDKHVVHQHFHEPTRYREHAHALLAHLRREGTDSPEHVERMLKLAHDLAHGIEGLKREMASYTVLRMPPPPHLVKEIYRLFYVPARRR